ncbi:TonB-dependent receptor [Sphingomonas oligophenolica]|uniref:TonB-dependent receptor n=1 Tax=Sphingomonas oligophenolica TaxID=301154 RepID=A0ABU9Y5A5_9SPHN
MSAGEACAQSAPAVTSPTEAGSQAGDTAPVKPAAASQSDDQAAEVVVTAERRATSLQRTSVAATVLTAQDLVKKSVNSVEQLQFSTPSLTVNTSGQANSFNIRGIGKAEISSSVGVGVITYRDGVATFPGYFQREPYYDIASVEVLRGPQGTFAGGNATGGAVFINEANPNFDGVHGFATGQYGNYNDVKFQGAINLPLSDTLALRFATNVERRDTFFHVSGPWTGNPGDLRSYSGRASLLWQPTSQLRVVLKGDYNNIDVGGYPGSPAAATYDPFEVSANADLSGRDEFGRISLNVSYDFDSGIVLRSISGYQHGTLQETLDYDGTSTTSYFFKDFVHERIWSQEFNLLSPSTGPFTWLVGAYYQNDKFIFPVGGYLLQQPAGGFDYSLEGNNPHTSLAGFGQVGYQLTSRLQATFGLRYSRMTTRNNFAFHVPEYGINKTQNDFYAYKKATGKIALNWTVDSNNFLYAFVATGSKSGGLNGPPLFDNVTPPAFKAEEVTDYELGWKATLLNGHLRTQLGGYYNRYKNFQVTIYDPSGKSVSAFYNVTTPTALYGVEASAQGSFGAFGFDFASAFSHSSLGTFFAFDPRVAHTGVCDSTTGPATSTGCIDLTGRSQTYAPRFTLSVGAQYAFPLSDGASLTPRVDFAHISSAWGTLFQKAERGDYLAERNIVNAQLTLQKGGWTIAGFGTNLTDQHYIGSINGLRRLPGSPRQYGVRVTRNF